MRLLAALPVVVGLARPADTSGPVPTLAAGRKPATDAVTIHGARGGG